ncbi:rubrerythrin [uncultured Methanobrevibacter sp.]|uniref:rubrerythrin n=1 Tax=uncultured Methanobrevibacter sp. TaxID=253161 RepID=UPI0025DC220D|nr:rubrerythrin family protein [uncultured Methanobrevibacter sp.]
MTKLKGSKTEKNLMTALEGEAFAHMKYQYYASQAKKDGFVEIQDIFLETSANEKEHGKVWFKLLHDGVPDTLANLKESVEVEKYEWSDMYKNFAETAREEGFADIAELFENTSTIEKTHEERFKTLAKNIQKDRVFKKSGEITWKCNNCGYLHTAKNAPEVCPMCDHPQAHFRKQTKGYK